MPGSCPVVVLGAVSAADWRERGLKVGQDTELGEDDGGLRDLWIGREGCTFPVIGSSLRQ